MDRNSRRSKGVGGQLLLGQPVMVKPSEAEKNLVQSTTTTAGGGTGPASGVVRRLYAGNLPMNITEDQLRQVFEPFGPVELVQLPLDLETRQCKGYGFIQFARLEDARAAQSLNGQLEIAGRTIKVSSVSEHVGMQDIGTNAGDLDDDEGGLALNAQSRALLMQKLDRSGIVTSVATSLATNVAGNPAVSIPAAPILSAAALPVVAPPAPADAIGPPSECLLLKNMFDPSVETEPDFDLDIKKDVQEECSKFGAVKHISVDKNSAGFVYLRFDKAASAVGAQRALHGRWFAGKMISATFMLPQAYTAKFPGTG
ncbi:unnamed protein product [Spirodela intermedia]|uniref:RRM domain-containing protein n=1 Tax=Spirodela intermedia TaxID=51605 RepID=A0A7I8J9R4_SPIIN|nr:unnamed protein product [Spirodela intermedia]CAA6666721.1 unnamed protein product [Spirodela intermedia]